MKLNYKRTILVGFAFFLICAFWQAYDTIIPKILTDKFGMTQSLSGIVMALDNIFALVLLPLFGAMSDKCTHRRGKRTPYILVGTVVAVVAFIGLSFVDQWQLDRNISEVTEINTLSAEQVYLEQETTEFVTESGERFTLSERYGSAEAFAAVPAKTVSVENGKVQKDARGDRIYLDCEEYRTYVLPARLACAEEQQEAYRIIYENQSQGTKNGFLANIVQGARNPLTPDGEEFVLKEKYPTLEAFQSVFAEIPVQDENGIVSWGTNPDYTNYVVPARQAYVWGQTLGSPWTLIAFIVVLLVVLIGMAIFRSPAVALMPDVTVKPLRSKANAVINLMGSAGGILVLGLGMGFAFNTGALSNTFMSYVGFFGAVAAIMVIALLIFLITVKEPKWAAEMQADAIRYGIEEDLKEQPAGTKKLSRSEKTSLFLILSSVVLWYMGYNAVTSKYSIYAARVLDMDYNLTLIIAQAAAIVSYLPIGFLSSKIGRKKAILIGVVILTGAFLGGCFARADTPVLLMNVMFACAGIGWATINVNSFPMVVELSSGSDIGRYTGYYYAASMAAQAITPFLSGVVMDNWGLVKLFPYAVVFAGLAFFTMLFVKHGDSRPEAKKGLEALNVEDEA